MSRVAEELRFRTTYNTAFCTTLSFTEHNSRTASKAKYQTAIHNSVKLYSFHGKVHLVYDLSTKRFLTTGLKITLFFHEMGPIWILHHHNIAHKAYTASWKNQLEAKTTQSVAILAQVVV